MAGIGPVALFMPSTWRNGAGGTVYNIVVDAATEYVGWVFQAHTTGPVLTKAAFRLGALVGNSPTYVVTLEGVGATGFPDGVVKGGASPVSVEITPAAELAGTILECTFSHPYASSPGEMLALVVRPKAGTTIDAGNCWSFTRALSYGYIFRPYFVYNDGADKKYNGQHFGVSDGTTWWGYELFAADTLYGWFSDTVMQGCRFTLPAGMGDTVACHGGWYGKRNFYAGAVYRLSLYDAADNVLASTDIDADHTASLTAQFDIVLFESAAVTLTCGATYRLVLSRVSGSNGSLFHVSSGVAAHLDTMPWQRLSVRTYGAPGGWTDDDASRPLIGPMIEDITEPAGGGGPVVGSRIIRGLGAL